MEYKVYHCPRPRLSWRGENRRAQQIWFHESTVRGVPDEMSATRYRITLPGWDNLQSSLRRETRKGIWGSRSGQFVEFDLTTVS